MPLRLVIEQTSNRTQVLVAPSRLPLAAEIISQLQSQPDFEIFSEGESKPANIIIYLVDQSALSQLHVWLDQALDQHAKFILVTNSNEPPLQEEVSLVSKFGRNFRLNYRIIEISNDIDTPLAAAEIIRSFFPQYHPPKHAKVTPPPQQEEPSKIRFRFFLPIIIFLGLLLAYPIALYGFLHCSASQLLRGNFSTSLTCAKLSSGLSRLAPQVSPYLVVSRQLSESLILANQFASSSLPYLQSFFGHGQIPSSDITDLSFTLSRLTDSLAFLQADLQSFPRLASLLTRVNNARTFAQKISPLVTSLPELLSLNGKSTILLLLQDSAELRPTGGFLSHIALLNIENGRLINVQIYDTAATDSQLRGQISPPADLARAIGESSWFLRDSNWDPDFPSSAARAAWFVNKELSVFPDKVISVHLGTLVDLLAEVGPLRLSELNLTVTKQNFFSQYLTHPDFLSVFYQHFFDQLRSLNLNQLPTLIGVVINSLESRQSFITSTVWNGEVVPPACRSTLPCVESYFYAVSSNTGVNKTNMFIQSMAQLAIQLDSARADFQYQATFTHSSSQTNWPLGHNKNYIRLYLPSQSLPDTVLINGQQAVIYHVTTEHGLVVLGVSVDTPPASSTQLVVRWHQPLTLTSRFHYQIDIPNQPGQLPYPLSVSVNYPKWWFASTTTIPTLASAGRLQYNESLSHLLRFDIDFAINEVNSK